MIAEEVKAYSLLDPVNLTATVNGRDADLTTIDPHGGSAVVLNIGVASGTPTLDVKMQESDPTVRGYNYVTAGANDNILFSAATTNNRLSAKFTQTGAKSIKYASLMLKQIGTIAAAKNVWVQIETDTAGSPSGTPVAGGTSIKIDPTTVSATYGYVKFTFKTPVDLVDATVYHVVLYTDYTSSGTNAIDWRDNTVASAGQFETWNGTTWTAASSIHSLEVFLDQYTFTDIAGATFAQVTLATSLLEFPIKRLAINTPAQKSILRPVFTVGGGSPNMQVSCDMVIRAFNQPVAAQA